MFPQTRPAAPIGSKSSKTAPGMAEMLGQDAAGVSRGCVPARQREPELSRPRVPFPPLRFLLLPNITELSPKCSGTHTQAIKIKKQNTDAFRRSSMKKLFAQ